ALPIYFSRGNLSIICEQYQCVACPSSTSISPAVSYHVGYDAEETTSSSRLSGNVYLDLPDCGNDPQILRRDRSCCSCGRRNPWFRLPVLYFHHDLGMDLSSIAFGNWHIVHRYRVDYVGSDTICFMCGTRVAVG